MLCLHQIAMIKLQLDYTKEKVCLEFSMSWTLERAALTKDLNAPSQIFLISKDLSTLFFLSLVLASSKVRPSLCLLSVLSQFNIENGFTCNRSLIENEFLSQIHSLIVDRVNWVSSSYLCKVCLDVYVICKMSN